MASSQGQRVTTIARKAPVFGKTLKHKVRAHASLECGASGLTVGVQITQEAKAECEKRKQRGRIQAKEKYTK